MSKQAMEMALEALEDANRYSGYDTYGDTIAALKEAIKRQGEPFAWYIDAEHEDILIINDGKDYDIQPDWKPLYLSAPSRATSWSCDD